MALGATWDQEGKSTETLDNGCSWNEYEDLAPDPRVMRKFEKYVAQIQNKSIDQQDRRCYSQQNSVGRYPLDPTSQVYCARTSDSLATSGVSHSVGERSCGSKIPRASGKTNRRVNKPPTKANVSVIRQNDEATKVGVQDVGSEAGDETVGRVDSTPMARTRRGNTSSQGELTTCNGTHTASPSPQLENTSDTKAEVGKSIMHISTRALDILCSMRPTLDRQQRKAKVKGSRRQSALQKRHRSLTLNNRVHGDRPPPQPPPQQSLFLDGKVCPWTSVFGATYQGASRGCVQTDALKSERQSARQYKQREICSTTNTFAALATEEPVGVVLVDDNREGCLSQGNVKVMAGLTDKGPRENVMSDVVDRSHADSGAPPIIDVKVDITKAHRLGGDDTCTNNDADCDPEDLFSSVRGLTNGGKTGALNPKTGDLTNRKPPNCAQASRRISVLSSSGATERLRLSYETSTASGKSAIQVTTLRGVSASRSLELYPEAKKFLRGITPVFFPLRRRPQRSVDSLGENGGRPSYEGESSRRLWTGSGVYCYGRCKMSGTRLNSYSDLSHGRTCDGPIISRRPGTAGGTLGFERGDMIVQGDDSMGSHLASSRPGAVGIPYRPGKPDGLKIAVASR